MILRDEGQKEVGWFVLTDLDVPYNIDEVVCAVEGKLDGERGGEGAQIGVR